MKYDQEAIKDRCIGFMEKYSADMETLKISRETAHREYMAQPYGDEVKGRSQFVSSDLFETIEWVMPTLMRIFFGGTDVCQFTPRGPEDEEKIKLLSEKVNFDFTQRNNGYLTYHDWFKDALLYKTGIVKYWWEKREDQRKRKFEGLTVDEYMLLKTSEVFVIEEEEEHTEPTQYQDEFGNVFDTYTTTFDVEGYEKVTVQYAACEVVPPEELIYNIKAKKLSDEDCVIHRKKVHKSVLIADYKMDESDIDAEQSCFEHDPLYQERFSDLGGLGFFASEEDEGYYWLHECYVNEWKKGKKTALVLTLLGNKVIKLEENSYKRAPFCEITPVRVTHRSIGLSYHDLLSDIQKLRTYLTRAILDNIYYQNNGRAIIDPTKISLDDLLNNNRPGGMVRTLNGASVTEGLFPIPTLPMQREVFGMLDTVDQIKENRTGVTKYNQGNDSDSLNKTASGISQIMSASQQRIELIARSFAETGVKDLFKQFAQMNIDYFEGEDLVKLNGEWQTIKPEDIDVAFDCTIDVGIGTGSKEMVVRQMTESMMMAPQLMQFGVMTPKNFYEIAKTRYEAMGYKNVDRYLTEPQPNPMMGGMPNAPQVPGMAQPLQPQDPGAIGGGIPAGPGFGGLPPIP